MSNFSDKTLVCRDCGKEFAFSAGEQEFYQTRGFSEPTRCPDCRAARKASRDADGGFGGGRSFDEGGRGGYGGSRGGYGGGRQGESRGGTRQMYKVTCADCGKETEVPFEPRTGRPVYCRECFEKRSGR